MRLYQLWYRAGDVFEGVVFVEANSLGAALWQADRDGLDPGGDCHCIELHPDDARAIPPKFIGRLLGEDEAAELDRIMAASIPKERPVRSVRRRPEGQRRRA